MFEGSVTDGIHSVLFAMFCSPSQAAPSKDAAGVGTCCLYFSATRPPLPGPMLYLNGEDGGVVNNCCFPSTVRQLPGLVVPRCGGEAAPPQSR